MSDFEHGCQYCYYEFFDSRAYPCSMCIYGEERTDKFQPKGKQNKRTEPNCSEKPNNAFDKDINVRSKDCETCKHNKLEWFSEVCDGCSKAHSHYEPKTEQLTCDGNCWMKKQNGEWLCEHCQRKPKTEPQTCANGCKWLNQDVECTEPHGECHIEYRTEVDEPQTDCAWMKGE